MYRPDFPQKNLKRTCCCVAPKTMLPNYLCTKQVHIGTFWKVRRIQIKIYPRNSIKQKYRGFYLTNEVTVHRLVVHVQLIIPKLSIQALHIYWFYLFQETTHFKSTNFL